MFVCLCRVVTDKQVIDAVQNGATTLEDVGDACDAGTGCGGCHEVIEKIIEKTTAKAKMVVLPVLCQ